MVFRFAVILSSILCTFLTPTAMAKESNKSALVLSWGNSLAQNSCDSPWVTLVPDPGFECSERYIVFRVAYNYNFSPAWGLEISGGGISNSRGAGTASIVTGDPYNWQMKTTGWTVSGVGNLNIGNNFTLFGKIGVARVLIKEDIHWTSGGQGYYGVSLKGVSTPSYEKNTMTYGVGFQYDFNKNFGLRIQYENFGKFDVYTEYGFTSPDPISLSVVSAGAVFLFD